MKRPGIFGKTKSLKKHQGLPQIKETLEPRRAGKNAEIAVSGQIKETLETPEKTHI